MGVATAKVVGRDHTLVLCDVRQDRLTAATAALAELGMTATAVNRDVTDRRPSRSCSTPRPGSAPSSPSSTPLG